MTSKELTLRMEPGTYYVWVGGSCDYAHPERAGGGAYIVEQENKETAAYSTADFRTTEFRMMLTVMLHAMDQLPAASSITFITNVAYIHQVFGKEPAEGGANGDLIDCCLTAIGRHKDVKVRMVNYHKYHQLPDTHRMAHEAMCELRKT